MVPVNRTFIASGTWTCPARVTLIKVLLRAGARADSVCTNTSFKVKVVPGTTYVFIVGAGGNGATDGAGNDTTFIKVASVLVRVYSAGGEDIKDTTAVTLDAHGDNGDPGSDGLVTITYKV